MPRQAGKLFAAFVALLAGLGAVSADIAPPRPSPQPSPPRPEPRPQPESSQSPGACNAVLIYSVDGANLQNGTDAATLTAAGTVSTAGWHDAALRFVGVLHPTEADATATYEFVACPPQVAAEVMSPVNAAITLPSPPANFHYVVIKAQTNTQTLDVHAPTPRP
jgi:hypothetical protein